MTNADQTTNWMQVWGGNKIHFPMTEAMLDVDDIARSLSMQCRFAGHVNTFYSVAEHSCHVSDYLWFEGHKELALAGLFHDASEAYLVDIPKPVKPFLTNYVEMEKQVMGVIEVWGGFHAGSLSAKPIKEVDCRILLDERNQLMDDYGHDWELPFDEGLGILLMCWSPAQAEQEFKERFERLS